MINYLKMRSGFSVKTQISFIIDLANIRLAEPSLPLSNAISNLETDYPHLVKVIKSRIHSGVVVTKALTETLDSSLAPYVQNDDILLSPTSGICTILLRHHSMFSRRIALSFVLILITLGGVVLREPALMIGSGLALVLIDFICKPVTELHNGQKLI